MLRMLTCVGQQHDIRLVIVAGIICALACVTSLNLLDRARVTGDRLATMWRTGAAVAFGGGVWATHFIAMLAFRPGLPISFAAPLTVISLLLPILTTCIAFVPLTGSRADDTIHLLVAGMLLGAAVTAMHFIGMAALLVQAVPVYAPAFVAAAIVIGVLLAVLALTAWAHRHTAAACVLLTVAVCGMHFTGMAGVTLVPDPSLPPVTFDPMPLAIAIAAVTLVVLGLSLTAALVDRRRASLLELQATRLRWLLDAAFEGLLFHHGNIVTEANAPLCALLGRDRDALIGLSPAQVLGEAAMRAGHADGSPDTRETEIVDADGNLRPVELLARTSPSGEVVIALRDLTERRLAQQRIQHLAHHDRLTGLANRALFADIMVQAIAQAKRARQGLAVLCLDLDGFKAVNDLLGHAAGDELLKAASTRLKAALRDMDSVARLGGDEFAILLPAADTADAASTVAARLVSVIARPFDIGGQTASVGVSVGIALYPSDAATPEDLLHSADLALYQAKGGGKGTYCFFEHEMDRRARERRQLEQDLRTAMGSDQLSLNYQPQLDINTLDITGYEVLVRWDHPRLGRVSPSIFVPIAETSGLIGELGSWVIETACAEAATWLIPCRLAVHISPRQFKQRDLPETIFAILGRTGLDPQRLELEITEAVLIADIDRAVEMLNELKAYGMRVALDDFGTGYSSLSYLRRCPFDRLKIDKSFTHMIGKDADADAIVRAVVGLGRSLSLDVTAEGVETPQELQQLRELGCPQAQGFLLGRPVSAEALHEANMKAEVVPG